MTAAHRPTSHSRNHWLWTSTDLALEIEHVQVVSTGIIAVTAVVTTNFLIATGAEGIFT
ncbi:Uncharacterised protein [Vibrio cholerae]|nr:Uncharacterised protein [Vibrio cholerae]